MAKNQLPGEKVLLLLDGHSSHETLDAIEFAKARNIAIFELPPHLTHILQPMDVGFFGPLKTAWNKLQEEKIREKEGEGEFSGTFVTRQTFGPLAKIAWDRTVSERDEEGNIIPGEGCMGLRRSFR